MTANLDLTKLPSLVLNGVDHSARPTWKLRETIEFYRDKLGLPLVHAITAKGWGRAKEKHADFIHFFFDAGKGATIAFFYYIGTEQPPELVVPRGYMAMANHTAWRVETEEELLAWQARTRDCRSSGQPVDQARDSGIDILPRSQLLSARNYPTVASRGAG